MWQRVVDKYSGKDHHRYEAPIWDLHEGCYHWKVSIPILGSGWSYGRPVVKIVRDSRVEYPNPLIISVPKLDIPPFGIFPLWVIHRQHLHHCPLTNAECTHKTKEKESPNFPICERLKDLSRFHVPIFDACLVISQPFHCESSFVLRKLWCRDWRVRQEYDHHNAPTAAQCAYDQEFVLPRSQSSFDLTDSIAKEPSNGNAKPIGCIPKADSDWLLAPCVPHRSN